MTWWASQLPGKVSIVVDNESWFLPYAHDLLKRIGSPHTARLIRSYEDVTEGDVAFYLCCLKITPPEILKRNKRNLVIHTSALPKGKGFAPLAWQILEGKNEIPICLIEMAEAVDAGPILYQDTLSFEGHELNDELRDAQGKKIVELCLRYLQSPEEPQKTPQVGEESFYPRRRPADSALDLHRTLEDQFSLLRVVDNEKYPAFFIRNGIKYVVTLRKEKP